MNKKYEIPEGLAVFMDKCLAAEDLRDRCIKFPFGFRRSRKSAREVQYFKRKFWTGFYELYPEVKGINDFIYKVHERTVTRDE